MGKVIDTATYIESGEFSFCSRCGEICVEGSRSFMCEGCKRTFFGSARTLEGDLRILFEKEIGRLVVLWRKELSDSRRCGLSPVGLPREVRQRILGRVRYGG